MFYHCWCSIGVPTCSAVAKKFEYHFKRTSELPCNPVSAYSALATEVQEGSDDEIDIPWAVELNEHFG